MKKKIVFGITGASGALYSKRIIEIFSEREEEVYLICSQNGGEIFKEETGIDLTDFIKGFENIKREDEKNFYSPLASGGNSFDVLICPSSMGFIGRCASGISQTLLERAVDVALKERRKVIFVTRESPLNLIHMENMLRLAKAGAIMMPASPFFYFKSKSIEELINDFSDRILKMFLDDYKPNKRWSQSG